jgi:Holliday junction DNA helicase RuvA
VVLIRDGAGGDGGRRAFFSRNVTTALDQVRLGAWCCWRRAGRMLVYEYKPVEVKQALVAHSKAQQEMVRMMLGLAECAPRRRRRRHRGDLLSAQLAVATIDRHRNSAGTPDPDMIVSIEGRITARTPTPCWWRRAGCACLPQPLASVRVGDLILLHTHLVVREDELTLVGFLSEEELSLFENLMRVQGVGPRLGLALLSAMAPDSLRLAISQEQPEVLARVPGIGKKTGQKIVLELRDKVGAPELAEGLAELTEADAAVIDALTTLGYSVVEGQRAVQGLPRDVTDVEDRLRRALASFGA